MWGRRSSVEPPELHRIGHRSATGAGSPDRGGLRRLRPHGHGQQVHGGRARLRQQAAGSAQPPAWSRAMPPGRMGRSKILRVTNAINGMQKRQQLQFRATCRCTGKGPLMLGMVNIQVNNHSNDLVHGGRPAAFDGVRLTSWASAESRLASDACSEWSDAAADLRLGGQPRRSVDGRLLGPVSCTNKHERHERHVGLHCTNEKQLVTA